MKKVLKIISILLVLAVLCVVGITTYQYNTYAPSAVTQEAVSSNLVYFQIGPLADHDAVVLGIQWLQLDAAGFSEVSLDGHALLGFGENDVAGVALRVGRDEQMVALMDPSADHAVALRDDVERVRIAGIGQFVLGSEAGGEVEVADVEPVAA